MASVLFGLFGYKLWICVFHPSLNVTMPIGSVHNSGGPSSNPNKSSGDRVVSNGSDDAVIGEEIVIPLDGKFPKQTAEALRVNANKIFRGVADTDITSLREASRV
jgi:hypothetical protein